MQQDLHPQRRAGEPPQDPQGRGGGRRGGRRGGTSVRKWRHRRRDESRELMDAFVRRVGGWWRLSPHSYLIPLNKSHNHVSPHRISMDGCFSVFFGDGYIIIYYYHCTTYTLTHIDIYTHTLSTHRPRRVGYGEWGLHAAPSTSAPSPYWNSMH